MPRQSISLTPPNEAWLKARVESEEFASKSEASNDLNRRARELEEERAYIRARLIAGEESLAEHGPVKETPSEMLAEFKEEARRRGLL